jgi:pilus assembly protein FimV
MMRLARWGALPLLAAPAGAWALGLGDIELKSALNQPFQAEIQLVSATPEEVADLQVSLAARDTFDRYGLDRPSFLSGLQFRVSKDSAGRDVIRVTSTQPIAEPFVTMLVQATWPRGRLLREYTVLLDPPVLLPGGPSVATVQPAESGASRAAAQSGGAIPRPSAQSRPAASAPASQARSPSPSQPRSPTAARQPAPGSYGPVQRAETLWGIASRLRPQGVSTNQMMVAIYQANPDAFDGNINLLRRGATLRMPGRAELGDLSSAAATAEVRRQAAAWQAREQQQARLRLVPPEEAESGPSAEVAASAPSAPEANDSSAADVGRLESEVASLRSQLDESRRLLEVRDSQLQELQARLSAASEAQPAPEQATAASAESAPGVDLESEPLFTDDSQQPPASASNAEASTSEAMPSEPAPAASAAPTPPPAAAPPASRSVTTAPAGPSLMSRIVGWILSPMVLIVVGLGAVVGAAAWFLRQRQTEREDVTGRWDALRADADEELQATGATARLRRQAKEDENFVVVEQPAAQASRKRREGPAEAESPPAAAEAGDDETLSSQTVINLDQGDPVAEADFHMAYGLYDQAAELLTKGLEADPGRRELKLKLLEVYFIWGNKEEFLAAAQSLWSEMGGSPDADWDKVVIMGKQICPDEPLFAQEVAAGEVDLDLEAGDSTGLDFAFEEKADAGVDMDLGELAAPGETDDTGLDLALEETGERLAEDQEEPRDEPTDAGLDIGERTAAGLEAALFEEKGDSNAETTPNAVDDGLAATQESPTIESPSAGFDSELAETMESPTLESTEFTTRAMESPSLEETSRAEDETVESPTLESPGPDDRTAETPTLASPAPETETGTVEVPSDSIADVAGDGTTELPTIEQPKLPPDSEHTAEIDLDDLGLDVADLGQLPDDLGDSAGQEGDLAADSSDLLSATGVTQVLGPEDAADAASSIGDEDATLLAPTFDDGTSSGTEVLAAAGAEEPATTDASATLQVKGVDGLDLNLDDLSAALEDADTVEQPNAELSGALGGNGGETPLDLDIGMEMAGSDDPTGTEVSSLDPQTMTEVGTKLDLARAYIDMGDPDGARSILEEVLDEGDPGQKQEAQGLMDVLSA